MPCRTHGKSKESLTLRCIGFFCYTGFYNGIGRTKFVMIQGIIGALGVRVPVSYFMSLRPDTNLFKIGLATPLSSIVQLLLCLGFMLVLKKRGKV